MEVEEFQWWCILQIDFDLMDEKVSQYLGSFTNIKVIEAGTACAVCIYHQHSFIRAYGKDLTGKEEGNKEQTRLCTKRPGCVYRMTLWIWSNPLIHLSVSSCYFVDIADVRATTNRFCWTKWFIYLSLNHFSPLPRRCHRCEHRITHTTRAWSPSS